MTLSFYQKTYLRAAMEEEAQSKECIWTQEELDILWNLTASSWEILLTLPEHYNEKLALRAIDLAATSQENR